VIEAPEPVPQSNPGADSVNEPESRITDSAVEGLTWLERFLRLFGDVRAGEGRTGLILLVNIFLVLMAYYLIKPFREGWLSISAIKGLSKVEVKAYSSFGQSMVLLAAIPAYAWLAARLPKRRLITAVQDRQLLQRVRRETSMLKELSKRILGLGDESPPAE